MKTKVHFKYFYGGFSPGHFFSMFPFIAENLEPSSEEDAELIVFSVWDDKPGSTLTPEDRKLGRFHHMPLIERNPSKVYLFWSGENVLADLERTDFAITHAYNINTRHLRLPYWVMALRSYGLTPETLELKSTYDASEIPEFGCNFIYSHPVQFREDFASKLSKYIDIVSPGLSWNNSSHVIPQGSKAKIDFQRKFKFTIAFENASEQGYTTEKIIDPLIAGSIPIYWGNDRANEEFNESCVLFYNNFQDADAVGSYINKLLNSPELYQKRRNARRFAAVTTPIIAEQAYVEHFFDRVFACIAQKRQK